VVVDEDLPGRRFSCAGNDRAFAGLEAESGWLWARNAANPLPNLAVRRTEPPNLALVFDEPRVAPPTRFDRAHLPLRAEAMAGLMMRVGDPTAARSAFAPWGVTRRATPHDAYLVVNACHGLTDASDGTQ
jgi:hypothetical protein